MLNSIVTFWEGQSALANFLAVAGVSVTITLAAWRFWKGKWKRAKFVSITDWASRNVHYPNSAKALKIVVVDDAPIDYPLDTLRQLGYSVTSINSLSLAEVPSLLRYDCVFLDIAGVLIEDPIRGGLEILKRIKIPNGPFVVAVSSKGFDITVSEFFMLADQRLKKPIPAVDVEGVIENAYRQRYSAQYAAERIDSALGFPVHSRSSGKKIMDCILSFIATGQDLPVLRQRLSLMVAGGGIEKILADINLIRANHLRQP